MGICSSCLGRAGLPRRNDSAETSRLLYEDTQQSQYGTLGNGGTHGVQVDPQDVAREEAALQKILLRSSDNLIDIFALQPQPTHEQPPAPYASATDSKLEHYQRLLQLITPATTLAIPRPQSTRTTSNEERVVPEALGDGGNEASGGSKSTQPEEGPRVLGDSADRQSEGTSSEIMTG
ncbi:MAG: hypothetical protein M1837_002403 [Sclerophora amabilis]|nr:MAG: hypothetical protein M1837_002403 [Sclerophora amabilis]